MARVSGLASDHHPQSSGDAPRRKKALKNTSANMDTAQASKRAASPTGELSQVKRKRVTIDVDDLDELACELDGSVSRAASSQPGVIYDHIQVAAAPNNRPPVNRRHSEPVTAAQDTQEDEDSQLTPPSTAPLTARPNPRGRPPGSRRARMSMPAILHHADEEHENGDNRQLQFAPLKAIIGGRIQRRLRRSHLSQEVNSIEEHEKEEKKLRKAYAKLQAQLREKDKTIQDLEFQLEAGRLGNIQMDEQRATELQGQLDKAREEIEDLRQSSLYTGDSRDHSSFDGVMDTLEEEDDGLMLVDPDDMDGPAPFEVSPLPNGEYAQRALALSSQVTYDSLSSFTETQHDVLSEVDAPDKISDKAVARYEGEINRLIKALGESQGALRVLSIELQNLHVLPPGASADTIVNALRREFDDLREQLETLVPNSTPGLTNSQILQRIPGTLEACLSELRDKIDASNKYYKNEQTLRRQYEHIIELLSRAEERNDGLTNENEDLRSENETRQQMINELEERVDTLNSQLDEQDAEIASKTTEINGLKDEVADSETALARLRASLNTYHTDLENLTATTTRLEEEHRQTIADMETAHAGVVAQLEDRLADEIEGRTIAENDAIDKKEYIEELEKGVEQLETEFDLMKQELDQLRERLEAETELRQSTEGERDEQVNIVYDQANRIENLEETLRDLEAEIAETKAHLETERDQRQETEAALDAANEQINSLNDQLHNAGIQANELRSKLFQVQQEKEQAIADLEAEVQEQEVASRALLDDEIQQREEAEQEVANLKDAVARLQNDIATLEENIDTMTMTREELEKDRDDRVAALTAQLADLKQKYTALENSSNSTVTTLQANITDLTNEVNGQRAEIDRITAEAHENDRLLRDELDAKNQQITELTEDLSLAKSENDQLRRSNQSLSDRVEEGAVEILRITDAHAQESNALHNTIRLHEQTIHNLQAAADFRRAEHEDLIAEKDQEIQELRIMGDSRATLIVELEAQITELKKAFAAAEEDTRTTIDTLTETQRQLQAQNQALADALKTRNANALKTVNEMKVKDVEIRTQGTPSTKVSKISEKVKMAKKGGAKGRVAKVSKRQWRDSGFGMDEDEWDALEEDELHA